MTHDPTCIAERASAVNTLPCYCALIYKVRANERAGVVNAVIAAQVEAGDINFCKDCADWAVAVIDDPTSGKGRS